MATEKASSSGMMTEENLFNAGNKSRTELKGGSGRKTIPCVRLKSVERVSFSPQ